MAFASVIWSYIYRLLQNLGLWSWSPKLANFILDVATDTDETPNFDISYLASERFQIDSKTGFFPSEPPLNRLGPTYDLWEKALDEAMIHFTTPGDGSVDEGERLFGEAWRESVRKLPILSVTLLELDIRQARRAHHVLSFLTQFYVQSLPPRQCPEDRSSVVIPSPLAIPFVSVSRSLGIAPILTYADTVLWNWELIDSRKPLSSTNIRIRDLFTGSAEEQHFFLTSARIEIRGLEALEVIGESLRKIERWGDGAERKPTVVIGYLTKLSLILEDIASILVNVKSGCDPHFFFFTFRPWIRGADQGIESPSWFYEGVDGTGITLQCSGPSAGQSALMHTFDVFLGIEHPYAEGPGSGCAAFDPHKRSTSSSSTFDYPLTPPPSPTRLRSSTHSFQTRPSLVDTSFIPRMRSYMPGPHQLFLSEFPSRPSMLFRNTPSLQPSYNACVMALKRFRDNHIRIVTQYVICPARSVPQKLGEESQPVRGTGGTALVPLLKVYRDTTHSACV